MRRYWVPKEAIAADQVTLTGDVLHHIRDVCRLHKGAKFEVLIEGKAFLVEVETESKHESRARILEERPIAPRSKPDIVLVMSIPRFPVFEAVIEKAVELGVARIQPVFSDFSFLRTKDDVLEKKRPRWDKIILSATQQSGRGDLMRIEPAASLKTALDMFNRKPGAAGLFAYEGEGVLSAKEGLRRLRKNGGLSSSETSSSSPSSKKTSDSSSLAELSEVVVFVGSEGGYSDQEVELFRQFGLQPVTLGQQVLRVETACVALVSIIKYDFDQMR